MNQTTTLPSRSEVQLEQTWDLASIFATPPFDGARKNFCLG